jgi:hypothetical protein
LTRSEGRVERTLGRSAPVLLLYLGLTVLFTWPLAPRLAVATPDGSADLWQGVWNLWWWKTAAAGLHNPYFTAYLFHPTGVPLVFHTHSPFNMVAGLPVTLALGPEAAYGFCLLLALWTSAFGAWLLAKEVTGSARGAFLAGLVFAFFPQRLEQGLEHLNLVSTQFLPLAVWAFVRLARTGAWRHRLGLGGFFALNALVDWQLGMLLLFLLAGLALAVLARPPRPRAWLLRDFSAAAVVATVLTLPAAAPLIGAMARDDLRYQKGLRDRGIDAAFLLRPPPGHLLGAFTRTAYAERRGYEAAGFTCYLGGVALVVAGIGLARRPAQAAWPALLLVGSLVLALGAHPWWDGVLHEDVTLPFAWMEVPILRLFRVANRFLTLTGLGLAVLVAIGFSAVRRRTDRLFVALAALLSLDYLQLPFPVRSDAPSPLYARLRDEAPAGAVLELPLTVGPASVAAMRAQTIHGRPIAGGYVSVLPSQVMAAIRAEPALRDVYGREPPLLHALDRPRLAALGFGVAVLRKAEARSRRGAVSEATAARLRALLEAACGRPRFEDEAIAVYDLTAAR